MFVRGDRAGSGVDNNPPKRHGRGMEAAKKPKSLRDELDEWTPVFVDGKTMWIDREGNERQFPSFDAIKASCDAVPKMPSVEDLIYAPARRIARELEGKNIPAAELTNEQKVALFTLAGFMKFEDGRLKSIRPVGIVDDGNGGYLLGIAPS